MKYEIFRAGDLAYYDCFAGLVKCKVIKCEHDIIHFKVTASLGAYKKGEVLDAKPRKVIPRSHVYVRSGFYRIRNNYKWV